ncbi:MAG TPA: transcription antitermination factor NusB, partial [Polyangia bacterium]
MNARDVARRVLRRVDEGAYATLALAGELERARLRPADRALATELTYGVLKQQRRLDFALAAYAPRGIDKLDARVLDAMRLGAYQILFLRVPAHAAVDDAVETIKRARSQKLANFANGLLRALARGGEPAAPSL